MVCIIDTSGKGKPKLKSIKEEEDKTPKSFTKSNRDLGDAKLTPPSIRYD